MKALALIIDKNVGYNRESYLRICSDWGLVTSSIQEKTTWIKGMTSIVDLFGEKIYTHLNLTNDKDLKKFKEYYDKHKKEFSTDEFIGNGLIITAYNSKSSKFLVNLVKKYDGTIVKPSDVEAVKNELLDEVNLTQENRTALCNFAGDDYALLLPFINSAKSLTPVEQWNLTFQDIYRLIPQKPGSVPPWEFIEPLFNGDLNLALSKIDRTVINTPILVLFSMLKNNVDMLIKVSMLKTMFGIRDWNSLCRVLGLPKGKRATLYTVNKYNLSYQSINKLVELITTGERMLKGGIKVDSTVYFKSLVTEIYLTMNGRI